MLDKLIFAFRNSEKLQAHVDFLLKKEASTASTMEICCTTLHADE